jgi:hypothetical protein
LLDPLTTTVGTFSPRSCAAGEACQLDWSHELVRIDGATVTIAHVWLCHS